MLPRPDSLTLSRYLQSAAETIQKQVDRGLPPEVVQSLRQSMIVVTRVAQQLERWDCATDWDARAEAEALDDAEARLSAARAKRAELAPDRPRRLERSIEAVAVADYLRGHPMGGEDTCVTEAKLLPGGRCKLTALVHQTGAKDLPAVFILRQDWQGGATDTTVAGEFELLKRVADGGVRAPRPLLLETDPAALGAPFILIERMPGKLPGSLFKPPRSPELALQLAEQMGRLHSLPVARFDGVAPRAALDRETLSASLDEFRATQSAIGIRSRLVERAIGWLGEHLDRAGEVVVLTHNDLGFHNILTEGDELTAILDWELAALGHPAADLGYVKPFVDRMAPWAEFVARYHAAGGWPIETETLRFHTVWNAVRLYGLIMQARAALTSGKVAEMEIAFACADSTMLLLHALGRELAEAGALWTA